MTISVTGFRMQTETRDDAIIVMCIGRLTSEHSGELKTHGITISMDGRGRCFDNIFIERL